MTRYRIKTTPKKAISVLKTLKGAKASKRLVLHNVELKTLVQKEVVNDLMAEFFKTMSNIRKELV